MQAAASNLVTMPVQAAASNLVTMPGYGPLLTALLSSSLYFTLALFLSLFIASPVLKIKGVELEVSWSGKSSG